MDQKSRFHGLKCVCNQKQKKTFLISPARNTIQGILKIVKKKRKVLGCYEEHDEEGQCLEDAEANAEIFIKIIAAHCAQTVFKQAMVDYSITPTKQGEIMDLIIKMRNKRDPNIHEDCWYEQILDKIADLGMLEYARCAAAQEYQDKLHFMCRDYTAFIQSGIENRLCEIYEVSYTSSMGLYQTLLD